MQRGSWYTLRHVNSTITQLTEGRSHPTPQKACPTPAKRSSSSSSYSIRYEAAVYIHCDTLIPAQGCMQSILRHERTHERTHACDERLWVAPGKQGTWTSCAAPLLHVRAHCRQSPVVRVTPATALRQHGPQLRRSVRQLMTASAVCYMPWFATACILQGRHPQGSEPCSQWARQAIAGVAICVHC